MQFKSEGRCRLHHQDLCHLCMRQWARFADHIQKESLSREANVMQVSHSARAGLIKSVGIVFMLMSGENMGKRYAASCLCKNNVSRVKHSVE